MLKVAECASRKQIQEMTDELNEQYELVGRTREDLSLAVNEAKEKTQSLEEVIEKLTSENSVIFYETKLNDFKGIIFWILKLDMIPLQSLLRQKLELENELVAEKVSFDVSSASGQLMVSFYI